METLMDWSLITQLPPHSPETQVMSYDLVSWIAVIIVLLFINTVLKLINNF